MTRRVGQLTPSERFEQVWSTPKGQALNLYARLGLLRTTECGGPAHRPAARMAALQARAKRRYERREAQA